MGLLWELVSLPLAPVRGTIWLAEQILAEAERQYYDPASIRRGLERVDEARAQGEIDDATADALEDELVARLVEAERPGRQGGQR
ncbi:gas vesicle protein GvpG [Xylanimonas sp. McL0601]|uniref:gas vesicle protein GvpG n=1 Tax=Xylanimonas sp. McL0601 TaxID=3414739 RepID=UPI003CE82113